jgi:phosphoenolpyruvate carboxylase
LFGSRVTSSRSHERLQTVGQTAVTLSSSSALDRIPWVFSWSQCRLMLPGWYGFGTAVNNWVIAHPVPETLL